MTHTIVGKKEVNYISKKTGLAVNGVKLCLLVPENLMEKGFEGLQYENVYIGQKGLPKKPLQLGDEVILLRDERGSVIGLHVL